MPEPETQKSNYGLEGKQWAIPAEKQTGLGKGIFKLQISGAGNQSLLLLFKKWRGLNYVELAWKQ